MNIKQFLNKKLLDGETQTSIARLCGISQSTVNNLLQGQENPRMSTLRRIATAYNVPLSQFIEGIGDVITFPAVHEGDELYPSPFEVKMIPLISSANAGPDSGIQWENAFPVGAEDTIACPPDLVDDQAYAMRVAGDSMSPKYTNGMIVYISPGQDAVNGDYVICKLRNGDTLIKRLRLTNGTVVLESINQSYDPVITTRDQIEFISKITHSREK